MAIDKLIMKLEGRIDSGNAHDWEEKLLALLNENKGKEPFIDAASLEYISSAGLRILMKLRKQYGDSFDICDVSPEIYEILETTGFTDMFNVKKKYREISLDGCEVIGTGFYGTVYRIDQDTIVKMYESPDAIPMIENEKRMAKMAFVKGIPTAISFDIVKADGKYGSVFELIKSKSFNDIIIADENRLDEMEKAFADLAKTVHDTLMDPGSLPLARDIFIGYIDEIKKYLDPETANKCREMLTALPDDYHVVHGDFHMKNVMMSDDEPLLIDMDTLSTGQAIFDLQALYVTYKAYAEDEPGNSEQFLGISQEMADHIWENVVKYYFADADADRLEAIRDKIKLVAYIRFLYLVTSDVGRPDLKDLRIEHTAAHIKELAGKVTSLERI